MAFNFKTSTSRVALAAHDDAGSDVEQVVVNTDSEGETQKAKAIALALRESEGMSEAIEIVAKAKEDWQGGPITVLYALQEAYGEDLDTFPEPDLETGNNPDKFKLAVQDSNGKTTLRATSFYMLFADATREGKAIVDELAFIKRAGNLEAVKDGIPDSILEMNIDQRETRANYLNGRRSTIKASYKKAMALYFQLNAVANLPTVGCSFVYETDENGDDTGVVAATTKPIMVWQIPGNDAQGNPRPIKDREFFSIGSFLKLDPKVAAEKGGNFKELKKTVARATGGVTGNNQETPAIKTVDTWLRTFVEAYRYMDEMQMDKQQKDIGQLYKLLKAKGSNELAVTIVEMRNYLDDIAKDCGLDKRYTALQSAGSDLTRDAA